MAEELTKEEKESFYDLASQVESYDPGLAAFDTVVTRAETFLNDNGGYDSMSYRGTLIELNDKWEYLDHSVKLTGRVYAKEEGIIPLAPGEWNGPHEDDKGTYFWVEDAEMISVGVFDALADDPGEVLEDGTVSHPVLLAYGFIPSDLDSDVPTFFATPNDILRAQYDTPTLDAIFARLHFNWPKQMKIIERRIDKANRDPQKTVDLLRDAMQKDIVQQACIDSDDFRRWLAQYLQCELAFDREHPYIVQLEGDAFITDDEDNDDSELVVIKQPTTLYLRVEAVDVPVHQKHGKNSWAEIGIGFVAPKSRDEDEGDDSMIIVPLRSIRSIQSTRPAMSLSESLKGALPYPPDATDRVDIAFGESPVEVNALPSRIVEYKRLEKLNALLGKMQKDTMAARRARFSTAEDARDVAQMLARGFHKEVVELGPLVIDLIRVSGHGVIKPNGSITTGRDKLHIDLSSEEPVFTPTNAADTLGCFEAILAEVDGYVDEEGNHFWQVAPKIVLKTRDLQIDMTGGRYGHPLLTGAVKSSVSARLDDSVVFEVPEYERAKRRNESLAAMALSHRKHPSLEDLTTLDQAFLHENPSEFTDAKAAVQRIRRLARRLHAEPDEATLEALRNQLTERKIQVTADTWFGPGQSKAHTMVGVVKDVFLAELPDGTSEIVAALASDDPDVIVDDEAKQQVTSQLAVLRTLESLRF